MATTKDNLKPRLRKRKRRLKLDHEAIRLLEAWQESVGPPPGLNSWVAGTGYDDREISSCSSGFKSNDEKHRGWGAVRFKVPADRIPSVKLPLAGETENFHTLHDAMVFLHDEIIQLLRQRGPSNAGVPWGEGSADKDPRRRMYGFLPSQRERLLAEGIRIERYNSDAVTSKDRALVAGMGTTKGHHKRWEIKAREHERTIEQACIYLEWEHSASPAEIQAMGSEYTNLVQRIKLPGSIQQALTDLTRHIHARVSPTYKQYVTMSQLVAIQPNLHNGALHLPLHLDFPRQDGFGIVIATVAIRGVNGSVTVLVDDGDTKVGRDGVEEEEGRRSWSFALADGECYVLSGNARNRCMHGVISAELAQHATREATGFDGDTPSSQRETLNLRYGLHSKAFAESEVHRHWPD